MNRRTFFKGLSLGTLGLYMRLAPNLVKAVPHVEEKTSTNAAFQNDCIWEFPVQDIGYRAIGRFDFTQTYPTYTEIVL